VTVVVDYSTETEDEHRARWGREIRRELFRWRNSPDTCGFCGERIGHFGGSVDRDSCKLIPLNLPLDEVRPNCYVVRRAWIGDAIRAACEKRGVQ
jgi:hypothetical protein